MTTKLVDMTGVNDEQDDEDEDIDDSEDDEQDLYTLPKPLPVKDSQAPPKKTLGKRPTTAMKAPRTAAKAAIKKSPAPQIKSKFIEKKLEEQKHPKAKKRELKDMRSKNLQKGLLMNKNHATNELRREFEKGAAKLDAETKRRLDHFNVSDRDSDGEEAYSDIDKFD